MILIAERCHINYDSTIFIRSDLKVNSLYVWEQNNVEPISIEMPGVVTHSVYIPNEKFVLPALEYENLPHIVIGDFNNHITTWGYTSTDDGGEAVEQWADSCNLTLIHNAKLAKSFNSARWKRGYILDLIFESESIANMSRGSYPSHATPSNLCTFRASNYDTSNTAKKAFNLRKADSNGYSTALDKLIENVEPIPEKYGDFTTKKCGWLIQGIFQEVYKTNYILGLSEESKSMYEDDK